jgi:hypothetical protein
MKPDEIDLEYMTRYRDDLIIKNNELRDARDAAETRADVLAAALSRFIIEVGRQSLNMSTRSAETLSHEIHRATTVLHVTGSVRSVRRPAPDPPEHLQAGPPTVHTLGARTARLPDPSEPVVE